MTHAKDKKKYQIKNPKAFEEIVTNSETMISFFQYAESIAHSSHPILITGETGVGKDLMAKSIYILSNLKGRFVAVNVAGLDDNIFSDTLFGHVKGAFTGADENRHGLIRYATNGMLLLDEIGSLSPASQVKLLRLLQEGEYLPLGQDKIEKTNARLVTSTNEDLWSLMRNEKFRKDLNFRLRTHHIHIPPLRERLDDIPLLVDHFLNKSARELEKKKPTPPKELYQRLKTYSFPGNVRELEAMVHNAVTMHTGGMLSLDMFKLHIKQEQESVVPSTKIESEHHLPITFGKDLPTIKQANKMLVVEAMKRANNNQTLAASMIGITRQALSKRLKNMKSDLFTAP
ncbi:MAG: sigma-54-dependent Fis family transcriptional regulator [Desulfobacterales bacterium]|nr:MAG: sigma-54-dependent Fis family transcriptional regulator [Desulfobacterales bacterium]